MISTLKFFFYLIVCVFSYNVMLSLRGGANIPLQSVAAIVMMGSVLMILYSLIPANSAEKNN